MRPTRTGTLLLTALGCGAVTWLLLNLVYADLPPLPWTGVPAMLVLAVAETWSARSVRARLAGRRPGSPIPPIAVARMAALAKASSLAAALIGGLAAGFLAYVSSSLDKPAFRDDAFAAGGTLAAAAALAAAALYLEYGCRARGPDGKQGPPGPGT